MRYATGPFTCLECSFETDEAEQAAIHEYHIGHAVARRVTFEVDSPHHTSA